MLVQTVLTGLQKKKDSFAIFHTLLILSQQNMKGFLSQNILIYVVDTGE
jgi:hypothetical protein